MSVWFVRPGELARTQLARELIGDDYEGSSASVVFVDAEPGQGPRLHERV